MNKGKRKKRRVPAVPFRPIKRDVGLDLLSAMRTQIFTKRAQVTQPTAKRHYFNPERIEFTGAPTLEEMQGKVGKFGLTESPFKGNQQMPFGGVQQQSKGFMSKGKKSKGFGNMKF